MEDISACYTRSKLVIHRCGRSSRNRIICAKACLESSISCAARCRNINRKIECIVTVAVIVNLNIIGRTRIQRITQIEMAGACI